MTVQRKLGAHGVNGDPTPSTDYRPTIVIDHANLDLAFGRLALVLRGSLEHLLGPEHAAIPPIFMQAATPVIVRRCDRGLETVPVAPQFFAAVIVPRVVKIDRLDRGSRKPSALRTVEAQMFFASRYPYLLAPIKVWRGTLIALASPPPPTSSVAWAAGGGHPALAGTFFAKLPILLTRVNRKRSRLQLLRGKRGDGNAFQHRFH